MKNKIKAIFMSLLLVAAVLVPSLANVKPVKASENIPADVNITVHKRVFKGNEPADVQNTGNVIPNFGGEALPNVGFTVYDISDEYRAALAKNDNVEQVTQELVKKYETETPENVAAEQKLTDKNGDVTFEKLTTKAASDFKTYIILETKSPSSIVKKAAPIVLALPLYAYDDNGQVTDTVLEDIHVYPKNVEDDANYEGKVTKELLDATVHSHANHWNIPALNNKVLSPRIGRLLQYKVTYKVPATTIFAENQGLTLIDDPGVGIVLPEKVATNDKGEVVDTIVDALDPKANKVENVVVKASNGLPVNATIKYTEDQQQGGNSLFEMQIKGSEHADLAGETLEITYHAYLAKTEASMDVPADNNVKVTADTTKGDQTSTGRATDQGLTPFATVFEKAAEQPLAVGGYNFKKVDADSGKALVGAQFVVYDTQKDNADEHGYVKFSQSETGRNDLKWVGNIEDATVYTSNAKGELALEYLPYGEYELIEIKAPEGYAKGEKLAFTVAKDTFANTKATPEEVKNAKKGILPATGGAGIYIFLVVGLALMGGAYVWFRRIRKNDNV